MGSNFQTKLSQLCGIFSICLLPLVASAQSRSYPENIRGYKVERTVVELRKPEAKTNASDDERVNDADVDQLITFGQPSIARMTPLGITFEVPVVVAPVKQSGKVDFLVFEDMEVNDHSVEIVEYNHAFDLPNKQPLTLKQPLKIYIYLPSAMLAALGEWTGSKDTWPVTGRVYVFGKFKKKILGVSASFKRVVPVELNLTMPNPLKKR